MNDRLKFRVWDKQEKEYVKDEAYLFSDGYIYVCGRSIHDDHDRYIVEQCTGLKAKDGRLIYEGDILEFYSMSLLDALSDRHLERRVGRVVWNSETLKIDVMVGEKEIPDLCKKTDDGQFVVIGNIHENPELLK